MYMWAADCEIYNSMEKGVSHTFIIVTFINGPYVGLSPITSIIHLEDRICIWCQLIQETRD